MPACARCGEENPERARYCWACGARVGREPGPAGAERKVVTALFVDLVGFTERAELLDPEDVGRILRAYHAAVRAEIERFGGTLEKFVGDAVLGLFGAPVAHEDDPERAVRAAFGIRRAIGELNAADPELDLRLRIGIATGEAIVDLEAVPAEGEPLAAGDVLNTAFRLQAAAASGEIVVGEETWLATAGTVEYRELEPVEVKGKREPVRLWQAVALRSGREAALARLGLAPLVGRSQELAALRAALVRARDGEPQLLTLVGPPGAGKTRLVWELYHALAEEGEATEWRQGRCLPYGEGVTFWALGEIVKAEAGILDSDSAESAEAKLRRAVVSAIPDAGVAAWVERHARPLVGLAGGEEPVGDRRDEAFAAWRRLFAGIASRSPLVLALEDLQWADDGLLDFVEALRSAPLRAPLAVLCTARSELLERRPGWPGVVELEPLSDGETGRLAEAILGSPLPPELQAALLPRAAGNPLYAGEYVRMLEDRQLVRRVGERVEWTGELPLPPSLHALVAARLDELPAGAKSLLQDAAVLGGKFWAGALERMSGRAAGEVEAVLGYLERRRLVRARPRTSVAGEREHAFSHLLVRDVAYGQIPWARRAERHRLAAEWIESLAPDREDVAEMLAYHYARAIELGRLAREETEELSERARRALAGAGDRALGLYAFAVAARFYRAALELLGEDDPVRPRLELRLGRALFWAEGGGEELLERARAALAASGDREGASQADVLLSRLLLSHGDAERAHSLAERAVSTLEGLPASRAATEALANLSGFLMFAERAEEAAALGRRALASARELGLDDLAAHALSSIGVARITAGDAGGLTDLEESVTVAESLDSPEIVRTCVNLGSALVEQGDLGRAFETYARGRREAERFGDARGLAWLAAEQVYERYCRGRWDDALRLGGELIAVGEAEAAPYLELDCRLVRARIRLARGDVEGAAADAERALAFAREAGEPQTLYPALAARARVSLAAGEAETAASLARELVALWERACFRSASFWTADLALVVRALGLEAPFARAAAARPPTRWLQAAVRLAEGDAAGAARLYAAIGSLPDAAAARRLASGGAVGGQEVEASLRLVSRLQPHGPDRS